MRYIVLDTETASLQGGVVELAFVEINSDLEILSEFVSYVNPERAIDPGAQAIHGISAEMVEFSPTLEQVVKNLPEMAYMVAHNCLTPDHEVLTKEGWKPFSELGLEVEAITWSPDFGGTLQWENCKVISKPYSGFMLSYDTQYHCGVYTPDHKVVFATSTTTRSAEGPTWVSCTAKEYAKRGANSCVIPASGRLLGGGVGKSEAVLRLLEAVRSDASIQVRVRESESYSVRFNLKKERKKSRLRLLLNQAGLPWSESTRPSDPDVTSFYLQAHPDRDWIAEFLGAGKDKSYNSKLFGLSQEEREILLDELQHWDGRKAEAGVVTRGKISTEITSAKRAEAEWLQILSVVSGKTAKLQKELPNTRGFSRPDGVLSRVTLRANNYVKTLVSPTETEYDGEVSCLMTSAGSFLVRRKGCVWVTGNCSFDSRMIRPAYAPKAQLCTLALARRLLKGVSSHKLVTLQKELGLPERKAHSALDDVKTCLDLLRHLLPLSGRSLDESFELAKGPKTLFKMPFGKYKGLPFIQVPKDYRDWLITKPDLDKDLKFTLTQLKDI